MRALRLLIFCCIAAISARAAATKVVLQFNGALSFGWTDNVRNVPLYNLLSVERPVADFFGDIRPSLVLTTGSPRAVSQLAYLFNYTYFFRNSSSNAYANRLEWQGIFLPTKKSDLRLSLSAAQAEQATATFAQDSAAAVVMRTDRFNNATFGFREVYSVEVAPRLRLTETFAQSFLVPISPRTAAANLSSDLDGALDYAWRKVAVGLTAHINHFYVFETHATVTNAQGMKENVLVSPASGTINTTALARIRHDFGNFWTSEAGLGFFHSVQQTGKGSNVGPAAQASLRYTRTEGSFSIYFTHATQPNALVAQLFITDNAGLSAALPLGLDTRLFLSMTGGYSYLRQLTPTGGEGSRAHAIAADVSINFLAVPGLTIFFRGQTNYQYGLDSGRGAVPSMRRDTVLLGISGFYPTRPAAVIPKQSAQRVDRTDVELIPEPHHRLDAGAP